mgnify:CR=1 FL=1
MEALLWRHYDVKNCLRSHVFRGLTLLLIAASWGCATSNATNGSGQVAEVIRESGSATEEAAKSPTAAAPAQFTVVLNEEVRGRKLKNNKFDLPVVVNPSVEKWVDYFTGKGRVHFEKYLLRSRYFIPVISKVLRANNMPQDLVYLAMIESGFNNVARSHAAAVGPWQFIKATGRRYGLTVNYWIDQRRDTKASTMAAIGYLRQLYQEFGSWEVAAASYNAGENKLRTAIRRYKTRDYWQLSNHRFLKSETRHYVPKMFAAAIIAKNPEAFGFQDPFGSHTPNPTLFDPNEIVPKELGEEPKVAADFEDTDLVDVADVDVEEDDSFAAQVEGGDQHVATSCVYMVANPNEQIVEFEVKGPADLFAVSRAANIPFSAVKMLNPELSRWCTPPYMKTYRVKLPSSSKDQFLASYNSESFDRRVVFATYKAKSGDTISRIARKFATQPEPIRELNSLGLRQDGVRTGADLTLPIPTGYKRVIASLYDEKPSKERRRRYRRRSRRTAAVDVRGAASGVGMHGRLPTRITRE